MRIVILGAFQEELTEINQLFSNLTPKMISKCRCLVGKANGNEIIISSAGIGTNAAAITTTILCEKLEPDLIIFCGVAGGLKSDQRIGDLVLANKIIDVDLHQLPALLQNTPYERALIDPHTSMPIKVEYPPHPALMSLINSFSFEGLKLGVIATSNIFPAPKSIFSQIKTLNCSAIEMESAGMYKAAAYYHVPVITIRAISNLLDEEGNDLGTAPDALKICSEKLATCLIELLSYIKTLDAVVRSNQQKRVEEIIEQHQLLPHPEGGWYRRTFISHDLVTVNEPALSRYKGESRAAGSSIMYLLSQDDFSAWHTVQSDETWCIQAGEPLLLRIFDASDKLNEIILDADTGHLQFTVRAGEVFSAESLGRYSLVSCIVTPGFDFKDFKLLTRQEFILKYPQYNELVRLIREDIDIKIPVL
jgi:predicted cupin superfamily sugar epimerase/nucleoside phosphorylase